MPLRVVEGAYELIEGASLYKTFTTGHSPVGKQASRPAGVGNASPFGGWRLMNKPLWGLRVLKFDGAIAPRVLKFDSGYAAEGCGRRL